MGIGLVLNWPLSPLLYKCSLDFEIQSDCQFWLVGLVFFLLFGTWPSFAMKVNQTAGAAFMVETPIIIASPMETTWVSVSFAVVPAINRTVLDIAFQEHQFMLVEQWVEHKMKICGDSLTTSDLVNITYLVFKGIEYEIEEIDTVLAEMRKRVTTFVDNRERAAARDKR